MPNLVESKDTMETTTTTARMVFPYLEELTIRECGQLTSVPCHFPSLKKLEISTICCLAFEKINNKLTTLTSLSIECVLELDCLPEQLLQNNTSLMSLLIKGCPHLESISPRQEVWACCTSLGSVQIKD